MCPHCHLALLFALSIASPGLSARPCDLRILVEDFDRRPAELPVVLITDTGKVIAKTRSVGGVAEVCDVGVETFSAVIGSELCGQVLIRHLEVKGPRTLTLRASYKSCHADYFQAGCTVLIRVMDGAGRRLEGATVQGIGRRYPGRTDAYGRDYLGMDFGTTLEVHVTLTGHRRETLTLSCREDLHQIEKTVVLKRE